MMFWCSCARRFQGRGYGSTPVSIHSETSLTPGYFSQSFGLVQAERRAYGWPTPSNAYWNAISGEVSAIMNLNASSGAFVFAHALWRLYESAVPRWPAGPFGQSV